MGMRMGMNDAMRRPMQAQGGAGGQMMGQPGAPTAGIAMPTQPNMGGMPNPMQQMRLADIMRMRQQRQQQPAVGAPTAGIAMPQQPNIGMPTPRY
jgi:hypothetical protein